MRALILIGIVISAVFMLLNELGFGEKHEAKSCVLVRDGKTGKTLHRECEAIPGIP
jgi:hypothetical protein